MNKKFLSAILFGALMVTLTGTFVSCKDYDDDIKDLQTQIDTNKTAIAELQKLVGAGKWVTNVAASGENLVVTMSDGSSVTVAGIKGADGVDGKNAAEWTISEDGFWCKDGEKTTNVAIAQNGKDGKNGVTAPSPSIGADGNWVVYSWDAEKGEFVAQTTEIPAAGTSAYAVKADGVYTLYIADENGEMQEIALPATSDSFVVGCPSPVDVDVVVEKAKWNPTTSNSRYKKLAAAFPEVAELKKGTELTQGGELPLMISPAAVELDNTFSFSLVDLKGKVADIELANPTKGIADDWKLEYGVTMSRSAEGDAGLWTLDVTPAYDSKKKTYASIENGALVVTNAKGTSSRTTFAYYVSTEEVANVKVDSETQEAEYAEAIDVLASNKNGKAIFTLADEYYGKYILEATNKVQIEKYDLSIEGSELTIGSMPANTMEISISLKMTALGLNGSTDEKEIDLVVKQSVGATAALSEKSVTLNTKVQEIRWDVEELGMTALQFDNFMTGDVYVAVTREADKNEDDNVEQYFTHYALVQFYNEKGKATSYDNKEDEWSDGEGVTFGFDVEASADATDATLADHKAEKWTAAEYIVSLISKSGNTVIYSAETALTVNNPELGAEYVKLVPAFVDENGVFQITGTPAGNVVNYSLKDALILGKGASIKNIVDLDNEAYEEEGREDDAFEAYPLVNNNTLEINKWVYENEWTSTEEEWSAYKYNQLYKTRNIRAMISLFGNEENVVPFDFQVEVKSELYTETVADAVTFDATKLAIEFGAEDVTTTKNVDESVIDIKAAITKALVQAGTDKGKTYSLFATQASGTAATYEYTYDYRIHTAGQTETVNYSEHFNKAHFTAEVAGELHYLLNSSGDLVQIEEADLKKFGMTALEYSERNADSKKLYIAFEDQKSPKNADIKGLATLYATWRLYYKQDGTKATKKVNGKDVYEYNSKETVDESHAVAVELYNKYVANTTQKVEVKYETKTAVAAVPGEITPADSRIASLTIAFAEPEEAKNYFDFNYKNSPVRDKNVV